VGTKSVQYLDEFHISGGLKIVLIKWGIFSRYKFVIVRNSKYFTGSGVEVLLTFEKATNAMFGLL
jgi:hypothetical protein